MQCKSDEIGQWIRIFHLVAIYVIASVLRTRSSELHLCEYQYVCTTCTSSGRDLVLDNFSAARRDTLENSLAVKTRSEKLQGFKILRNSPSQSASRLERKLPGESKTASEFSENVSSLWRNATFDWYTARSALSFCLLVFSIRRLPIALNWCFRRGPWQS